LGRPVVQLVDELPYKPEVRGFDFRFCNWNFSLAYFFRLLYGRMVDSSFNRPEYQRYLLGLKAAGA
jgi:hypothetical protein